jgi:hypothetical protein
MKQVTVKKIGVQGSSPGNKVIFWITGANETITAADMQFKYAFDGVNQPSVNNIQFIPTLIETVMVMGTSNATVDGSPFNNSSMWEMSALGGIPISDPASIPVTFATPASGNLLIELRGTSIQI